MTLKRAAELLGLVLAVVAFAWLLVELIERAGELPPLGVNAFAVLAAASALYALQAIIASAIWCHLLRHAGEPEASLPRATAVYCLSQVGKYLPGNVAHYLGRVALSQRAGWGTAASLYTIFTETVWSAAVAACLALLGIAVLAARGSDAPAAMPAWPLLLALLAAALLAPYVGRLALLRLAPLWYRSRQLSPPELPAPPGKSVLLATGGYLCNYLLMALAISWIAHSLFAAPPESLLLLAGIYAAAWIVGFITPGAPAGLGIRELILVAGLTPLYGTDTALALALTLRLVTTAGDGLVFLLGLAISRYLRRTDCGKLKGGSQP